MTSVAKPILFNGYALADGTTVLRRVERVFFTEVYDLSNASYLYVFTELNPEEIVGRKVRLGVFTLTSNGKAYPAVIVARHSRTILAETLANLTAVRGLDSVAGLRELKARLVRDVIEPLQNPEKYRKFKLSIPNGILLYGPPGCGKTFIVKKLAEELSYNFLELRPSSVATPWVHGAVGNIAKVFDMAKSQAPAIIFIDEIEGLIPKREELGSHADIKKEEINEFLLQLNNASESGILVIAATNRPQMIDTAILRSGRMDKRIFVPPPDFEARKEMFKLCLSERPHDENIDFDQLAEMTGRFVGSDIELIVTNAARNAVDRNSAQIDENMLAEVIAGFPRSITDEEIDRYLQYENLERL